MSRFVQVFFIVMILLVAPGLTTGARDAAQALPSARIKVGDVAPDFSLTADNGQLVHLSDYLGKKRVVVFFFSNIQAADCRELCCAFRDCYKKYKDKQVEILAISPDSISELKAFKTKYELPYLILSDPGNKVRNQWRVPVARDGKSCKVTYIIDKRGKVKKIITSEGTPIEYMKEVDGGLESTWFIGG